MRSILPATCILALLVTSVFSEWSSIGLPGIYCEGVQVHEGRFYAATAEGIKSRAIGDAEEEWKSIGPSDADVLDFIVFDSQEIIASKFLRNDIDPSDTVSILRTTDGGATWMPYQNGFGGPNAAYYGYGVCTHLEHDPSKPDTLYARGEFVAAKTYDRGQSWTVIFPENAASQQSWDLIGYQATIMDIDKYVPGRIWVGGESAIFQGYLAKSLNRGDTWTSYSQNDFFEQNPGDNACYTVVPNPEDPQALLLGMEGFIFKSPDEGETWALSHESPTYAYFIDIENSPTTEDRVYATGSDNGTAGGNLFFLVSDDFGETWEKVSWSEGPDGLAVNDLIILEGEDRDILVCATGEGLFTYAEPPTGTGSLRRTSRVNRTTGPRVRVFGAAGDRHENPAFGQMMYDLTGKRITGFGRNQREASGVYVAVPPQNK